MQYYQDDGDGQLRPATKREWLRNYMRPATIVGRTTIDERTYVSTVFLGVDHSVGGAPLLYETMVFGPHDTTGPERYSTRAEAEAGHAATVARVTAERGDQS